MRSENPVNPENPANPVSLLLTNTKQRVLPAQI
jgi:hypothetical protein